MGHDREGSMTFAPVGHDVVVTLKFKVAGPRSGGSTAARKIEDYVFGWKISCQTQKKNEIMVISEWTEPFQYLDIHGPVFPTHAEPDLLESIADLSGVRSTDILCNSKTAEICWDHYLNWLSEGARSATDMGFGPEAYFVLSQLKSLCHDLGCVMCDESIGSSGPQETARWLGAAEVLGLGLDSQGRVAVGLALDELSNRLPEYYGNYDLEMSNNHWVSLPAVREGILKFRKAQRG